MAVDDRANEELRAKRSALLEADLAERDAELAEREAGITRRDAELAERDAELAGRDARVADLVEQIAQLTAQVSKLTELLGRNSSNSHLPPSSDGPGAGGSVAGNGKPKSGRKPGGQKGHRGSHRVALAHATHTTVGPEPDHRASQPARRHPDIVREHGHRYARPGAHSLVEPVAQPVELLDTAPPCRPLLLSGLDAFPLRPALRCSV